MEEVSRKTIVYDILFEVEKGKKSAKQAQGELDKLGKQAKKTETNIGGAAAAFKGFLAATAVQEALRSIVQIGKESVQLALKAQGVKNAFDKLNNPALLKKLQEATRGTVANLELMQVAVRADKFKIPLQKLGSLFQFAQQRARETGQAVDYLTNSIIDGIGRKSPLILDNLGLSAAEISSEFKRVGDFGIAVGNIIEREMGKAGDATEVAADSVDAYLASIQNLKLEIGNRLLPILGSMARGLNEAFKASSDVKELQKAMGGLIGDAKLFEQTWTGTRLTEAGEKLLISLRKLAEEFPRVTAGAEDAGNRIENIFGLKSPDALSKFEFGLKAVAFEIKNMAGGAKGSIPNLKRDLDDLNKILESPDGLILTSAQTKFYKDEVERLDKAIKALTETQKEFNATPIKVDLPSIKETTDFIIEELRKAQEAQENYLKSIGATIREASNVTSDAAHQSLEDLTNIREELKKSVPAIAETFSNLATLAGANADSFIGLAIAQVIAANAQALAVGVAEAVKIGFPQNIPAVFATIATLTGVFTQIKAIGDQARAAKAQQFAEGVIDLHAPGEKMGKDSIPAVLMPGESVMTTKETMTHKPLLEAIRSGTLEDLIHQNYVQPALAMQGMEHAANDSMIDYTDRFYRQYLATGEGNGINKRALRHLESMDRKLSGSDYVKKYRR